jgi:hypothetical protein
VLYQLISPQIHAFEPSNQDDRACKVS